MFDWFVGKDISIVGGAGGLFESNQGDRIDSHQIVIRLNRGVLIKDEKHQGTKTDYWAYPNPSKIKDIYGKFKYKTIHLDKLHRDYKVHKDYKDIKTDFYVPIEIIDELCDEKIKYGKSNSKNITDKPSSGIILLYYLTKCNTKKITLYGFDWKKTGTWYDYQMNNRKIDHNWETEEKFIKHELVKKYNIEIVKCKDTNVKYVFEDCFFKGTK